MYCCIWHSKNKKVFLHVYAIPKFSLYDTQKVILQSLCIWFSVWKKIKVKNWLLKACTFDSLFMLLKKNQKVILQSLCMWFCVYVIPKFSLYATQKCQKVILQSLCIWFSVYAIPKLSVAHSRLVCMPISLERSLAIPLTVTL